MAYKVWFRELRTTPEVWEQIEREANLIGQIQEIESYISPGPDKDWLSTLSDQDDEVLSRLLEFSRCVNRWQQAFFLPFDQLILTVANDIFETPEELSLAQKMSVFIKSLTLTYPDWDKSILVDELKSLARNERKAFFGGENIDFDPDDHKGKVVVTTAHKAKGLEWDRVYLMSVNNYNFPSGSDDDRYIFEKWFIRDQLNLPAEVLSQLKSVLSDGDESYTEGDASQKAREEYIRERLRLMYVAITRARKDLIITWNTGRYNSLQPALALSALLDKKTVDQ
jgi:DNA helicase-2/ATP-dependent DNA helicase PcrA